MWLGEYLIIYSGVERDKRAKEGVVIHSPENCKPVQERIKFYERLLLTERVSSSDTRNNTSTYNSKIQEENK